MRTACPNCGAPVEFRYDDSFVRICESCHNAVLRTDRGIDSLGKVADLVPIDSPLKLFSEGHYGSTSFLLVGMAQIRHSAGGIWQEWYAKLDGGQWGWLAEAQGRYYLTFEQPAAQLPRFEDLAAGSQVALPVQGAARTFTVSEHTSASYQAAAGELPYRLVPDGAFRYVDLDDGQGTFATIDYGGPGDTPALYIGHQATLGDLGISGGEVGPSRDAQIKSKRLACPNCNGALELRAPDQSQRVVCPYCNALVGLEGDLQVIGMLANKAMPSIPLGSVGTFSEGEFTVIGYLQRSANAGDTWYPFDEYLLYAPAVGFRWLVCSDGHWSYVQPVAVGAIENNLGPVRYDGVRFQKFASAPLRVDLVYGELYWQVTQGETVESEDHIAPPAMLSLERTASEETWSLSTYMTISEVERAFGRSDLTLPMLAGKAPNQVNRADRAAHTMMFGMLILLAMGAVFAIAAPNKLVYEHAFPIVGGGKPTTTGVRDPTPAITPADPCVEYKAALAAITSCEQIPKESRDAMTSAFGVDANATPELCQAGLDSAKQVLASTTCTIAAPAATGSGAGSGSGSTAPAEANVFFSEPFQLEDHRNIELHFSSQIDNDWVFVTADLVNQQNGQVVELEAAMEHWSGVEDGESWSEGSRDNDAFIGPQPAGTYLLRLEGDRGIARETDVAVQVHQGVFRGHYFVWALVILGVPWLLVALIGRRFERTRWENSDSEKPPSVPAALVLSGAMAAILGCYLALKIIGVLSSIS